MKRSIYQKSIQNSPKKTRKHGFLMNLLPLHILIDILSRLPVKTIIHCKCVCKAWLNLISDREFIETHLLGSKPGLVVHYTEMFKNFLRLVDFEDDIDRHSLRYDPKTNFNLTTLSNFPDADIMVDGSINGFLLLRDVNYKHETLYICNPVTRQYVLLPEPNCLVGYPNVVTHGFGVGSISGQYKVVRIYQERELHSITGSCLTICSSKCEVYVLGTGLWRDIGEAPFAYDSNSIGLFFKGNLHWLVNDLEGSDFISCFDVETESFLPFPSPFPGSKVKGSLGSLGDFFSFCDNTSQFEIDIWVMKEYGVKESWVKEIVITNMPRLLGPPYEVVYALQIFRDGVVLLLWGDCFMLFYCSKGKTAREVDLNQTNGPNCIEAIRYAPSFLSLGSFGEDVYML